MQKSVDDPLGGVYVRTKLVKISSSFGVLVRLWLIITVFSPVESTATSALSRFDVVSKFKHL